VQCALQVLATKYPDEWGKKYRIENGSLKDGGIKVIFQEVRTAPKSSPNDEQ
jgi:hypothetical protein